MDFSAVVLTEAQQAFAEEVRAFLDEHLTDEVYARSARAGRPLRRGVLPGPGRQGLADAAVAEGRRRRGTGRRVRQDPRNRAAQAGRAGRRLGTTDLVWPAVEASGDPGLRDELKPKVANGDGPVRPGLHRAGRRVGHRRGQDPGGPRRRRVGHQRAEDLHLQRPVRHARLPDHADRPDAAQAQGPDHVPGADQLARASSASRCPPSATRRPTSATTATSGSPTGTASARSTTAGPSCTARWTPSTTSANTPASSRTSAPARASCVTWRSRSRPPCAGPRTLRTATGR